MSQPKNTDPPPNQYNVEAGYKLIDTHQPMITTGFVKNSHHKKRLQGQDNPSPLAYKPIYINDSLQFSFSGRTKLP